MKIKIVNSIEKSIIFLITVSLIYSALNFNLIMISPFLTVVFPYNFMKTNNLYKDRKIFSNILIFNILIFVLTSAILQKSSAEIFETITNLIFVFVYFLILKTFEIKRENLFKNPEKMYKQIYTKIEALENMKNHLEEKISNIENETKKNDLTEQIKIIDKKLNELKLQSNKIKVMIDNRKENEKNNEK